MRRLSRTLSRGVEQGASPPSPVECLNAANDQKFGALTSFATGAVPQKLGVKAADPPEPNPWCPPTRLILGAPAARHLAAYGRRHHVGNL